MAFFQVMDRRQRCCARSPSPTCPSKTATSSSGACNAAGDRPPGISNLSVVRSSASSAPLLRLNVVQLGLVLYISTHNSPCLSSAFSLARAQGYTWIAYWAYSIIYRDVGGDAGGFAVLRLGCFEGQSVGPFPRQFQALSTGFIPICFPS